MGPFPLPKAFEQELLDEASRRSSSPPPDLDEDLRQDFRHHKVLRHVLYEGRHGIWRPREEGGGSLVFGDTLMLLVAQVVTIDDEFTTEIDDGLSVEWLDDGRQRLWVHIADPTRWLELGDSLDTVLHAGIQRSRSCMNDGDDDDDVDYYYDDDDDDDNVDSDDGDNDDDDGDDDGDDDDDDDDDDDSKGTNSKDLQVDSDFRLLFWHPPSLVNAGGLEPRDDALPPDRKDPNVSGGRRRGLLQLKAGPRDLCGRFCSP